MNLRCWPILVSFLEAETTPAARLSATPFAGRHILDIACGNGLTSHRLASLGAQVTALDFSANLIEKAKARENPNSLIVYHIIDATSEEQLLSLGEETFDSPSPTWHSSTWQTLKLYFEYGPDSSSQMEPLSFL